ncbi:enoyl-CoA hydratase-related protein [Streptomyces sp. LHD-70]|uniref:enoyl-CoA hydratase/isomerase family protein n=1 Tax=Streptomyces sp. LHD-70 TaxID=3072140 RepID=UPI00280D93FE|nr:enoyl-CoA hydratase-related protein [Streptomyces sp. LHD-70]MDQ8705659.1 enoyl-CoA hydratase-related protein [Streptomyces sp. LHD-70]
MTTTARPPGRVHETITVDVTDRVAVITINRPEVRNAVNRQVQADLRQALADLRDDETVGAVVFTGAGDHSFIAGADITQLKDYTLHTALESEMQRLYDEIEAFEKPTIAAVNGYALGGGCELAMACDIRVAADTARFGLPETNLSVLPGAGGTQRLARLVGTGRAVEMILTGRLVDAAEASAIGLVTSVVPADALLDEVRRVAGQVLRKGPLAVRLAKLVIRSGMDADQSTGLVIERLAQALLYTSDDKREGTEAFLAKRPPVFRGR